MRHSGTFWILGGAIGAAFAGAIAFASLGLPLPDRFCGQYCFRSQRPAPYRDANYFSQDFVRVSIEFPLPRLGEDRILRLPDFKSPWTNNRGGRRVTAFQPEAAGRNIYLIGGSSIEGDGVPDEWTIASRLQKILGSKARVENYGYSGASIINQVDLLKSLPLTKDDTVVFIDGVNDAMRMYLLKKQTRVIDGERLQDAFIETMSGFQAAYLRGVRGLRGFLATVPGLTALAGADEAGLFRKIEPPQFRDRDEMDRLDELTRENYLTELASAQTIVSNRGARFVHYFQPYLSKSSRLSSYEAELMTRYSIFPLPIQLALESFRTIQPKLMAELQRAGIDSRDLDGVISGRAPDREVYLDFCHLNHVGNELIARRLAHDLGDPKLARHSGK